MAEAIFLMFHQSQRASARRMKEMPGFNNMNIYIAMFLSYYSSQGVGFSPA